MRHESIDSFPVLAIGEHGTVTHNSELFYLNAGSIEVECSTSKRLTWINAPQFGKTIVNNFIYSFIGLL